MNWLAHFVLSPDDDLVRLGNWLPDVLSRTELERLTDPRIRHGIALHRLIDQVTDQHASVAAARARLPNGVRRFAGVVLDVTWDHFLARDFVRLIGGDLNGFVSSVEAGLLRSQPALSREVQGVVARMIQESWLRCYGTTAGVELTLNRISRRLSDRARTGFSPATARACLENDYAGFEADFTALWTDLRRSVTGHDGQGR